MHVKNLFFMLTARLDSKFYSYIGTFMLGNWVCPLQQNDPDCI